MRGNDLLRAIAGAFVLLSLALGLERRASTFAAGGYTRFATSFGGGCGTGFT